MKVTAPTMQRPLLFNSQTAPDPRKSAHISIKDEQFKALTASSSAKEGIGKLDAESGKLGLPDSEDPVVNGIQYENIFYHIIAGGGYSNNVKVLMQPPVKGQ